jgi:hypothetical protein
LKLPTATIPQPSATPREKTFFDRFVDAFKKNNPDQVGGGVYVDQVLALRVVAAAAPITRPLSHGGRHTTTQFLLAFTVADQHWPAGAQLSLW